MSPGNEWSFVLMKDLTGGLGGYKLDVGRSPRRLRAGASVVFALMSVLFW